MPSPIANPERVRLDDCFFKDLPWKKWGPYLSERQWGTVREDYAGVKTASPAIPTRKNDADFLLRLEC